MKKLIFKFSTTNNMILFCDLHGHSVKKNIFIYGCHDKNKPFACREFPFLISKLYQPFSFKDCNFLMKKEKRGTARVALYETFRIPNIFTLESSFCGPSYDNIHVNKPFLDGWEIRNKKYTILTFFMSSFHTHIYFNLN